MQKIKKIQRYLPQGLTSKILNQKDKIEGERKQVTIMFCDLEGFTALVERIGPEEAYYFMDQVYEILIHTVHEFEGIVNEMTGDGIMALFGAPIALALYNRGQFEEAVEYFDKALNYYWVKSPAKGILGTRKVLSAFLHFLLALYIPSLKFRRTPSQQDSEVVDLYYKKCEALGIINPKRFFVESLCIFKEVTYLDLRKYDLGLKVFAGASALFSFTGISFRLSR